MIVLPTMGRPENLKRFIRAYKATCATLPIHVVFDAADAWRYNEVVTPEHWKRVSAPAGTRLGGIFNLIYKNFPNEPYYGMVPDDVIPETSGWDTILAECCQPNKIAWGWDGIQNENLPCHPFIGGDLIRALGWWAAPGVKHWFVDNIWKDLVNHLDCGQYLPNVKMPHHHYINGKAQDDRTYREQPCHETDANTYFWFTKNEFPAIIDRIRKINADTINRRII